jgi:PII-like signaling protein
MKLKGKAKLLRVFVGEADRVYQRPLYEAIVYGAKRFGLAGATVHRGIMSYGANSRIHSSKIFTLSDDLPIIIELVDSEEKVNGFLHILELLIEKSCGGGMITMEQVDVIRYQPQNK